MPCPCMCGCMPPAQCPFSQTACCHTLAAAVYAPLPAAVLNGPQHFRVLFWFLLYITGTCSCPGPQAAVPTRSSKQLGSRVCQNQLVRLPKPLSGTLPAHGLAGSMLLAAGLGVGVLKGHPPL